MSRFPGHIIKLPANTPSQSSAPGVWTLKDQLVAQRNNQWPFQRDPDFRYTTLLLQGNVPNTTGPQAMNLPLAYNSDASSNNFLITPNGDVSPRPFSPYMGSNYSVFFDGSGDYLTATNSSAFYLSTGNFTVEAWVYKLTTGTGIIVSQTQNTSVPYAGWLMYVTSGNLLKFEGSNGVNIQASVPFPINQWVHVAAVRVGSTTTLYMDGSAVATGSVSITDFSGLLTIGQYTSAFSGPEWNGYISNLRIVKGTAVYTSSFTPPTQPLQNIAGTSLLTCQSNRLIDNSTANSGTGFTITRNGDVRITDNSPFVSADFTTGSGYFDGGTDFLQVANNAAFGSLNGVDYTIEFWAYLTTLSGDQPLLACTAIGASGFAVWSLSGQLAAFFGSGTTITGSTLTANQWNHIAIVRTSTNTQLYLNGATQGTPSTSAFGNNTTQPLMIGGLTATTGWNSDRYVTGYISGLRIIKGQALATGNFTPPTTAPTTTTVGWTGGNVPTQSITGTVAICTLLTRAPSQNHGFIDSSPNEFIVTRNGNVSQGTFSPFSPGGWSNLFNGSNGITVPQSSAFSFSGEFTWEAFVCFNALPGSGVSAAIIMARGSTASNSAFQLGIYNDPSTGFRAFATISIGSTDYNPGWNIPTPVTGVWYHIAIVRNTSNAISCYWDSSLRTLTAGVANAPGTTNTPSDVVSVGYRGTNLYNDLYLNGYLSNVRMTASALYSGSSIQVPTAPFSPAVANTRFLTCQSNRFAETAAGMAVTLRNTPSVQAFSPFAPANSVSPLVTGGSGYFDGTGSGTAADYLTVPDSPAFTLGSGDFTLETWIYSTVGSGAERYYIAHTDNATAAASQFALYQRSADAFILFEYYVSTTANSVTSSAAITLNQWNHIVACRSGGTLSLFVNGVRVGSTNIGSTAFNDSASALGIGGRTSGAALLTGNISGMRLVRGTDVYGASNTNIIVPTAPPTAIPNTSLLLNFTGGGIVDATGRNVIETVGKVQIATAQAKWDFQRGGAALQFDGGYVNVANQLPVQLGSSDFTFETWARFDDFSNTRHLAFINGNASAYAAFRLGVGTDGRVFLLMSQNGSAWAISSGSIGNVLSTATWYYIAVQRSSAGVKVYVDGTQIGTTPAYSLSGALMSGTVNYIGEITSVSQPMKGYMSNPRLTVGQARTVTSLPNGPFPIG